MTYRIDTSDAVDGNTLIQASKRRGATFKELVAGAGVTLTAAADKITITLASAEAFTDLDLGASGTAGSLDIFPVTAAKGKLRFSAANSAGDTVTTVVNASQATTRTYTIQDSGADATFLTDKGVGGSLFARCGTQIDAVTGTTGTTLTNITGLTVNLLAGATYAFEAYLTGTSTTNGGLKLAMGGTATATSISYTGKQSNANTSNAQSTVTTLGSAVAAATTVFTVASIVGTIVVNAAGTLTVQFAQNAAHADTTSVFVNSHLRVQRIA